MRDIQFKDADGAFNIRVTGALIKDGKVLLNRGKADDYWTFVGGKQAFGESLTQSLVREYKEEVGISIEAGQLSAIVENFFTFEGMRWHQYLYFFEVDDPNNEIEVFSGSRDIRDNPNGEIRWFSLNDIESVDMKPSCSYEILKNIRSGRVTHIVHIDP